MAITLDWLKQRKIEEEETYSQKRKYHNIRCAPDHIQEEIVRRRVEEKLSSNKLGEIYGLSPTSVRKILTQHGVDTTRTKKQVDIMKLLTED